MQKANIFSRLLTLAVLSLLTWAVLNLQVISDWYILSRYDPPAEIARLADQTTMTPTARQVFYASAPELNQADEFNQNCNFSEHARVLGCYTHTTSLTNSIFILDITESDLEAIEPVTAAHEMLHAAYDRLSGSERRKVDELTQARYQALDNPDLDAIIDAYRTADPSSVSSELHSILGTEIVDVGPELEEYYSQYFTDRQAVVAAYSSYKQIFDQLESEIEQLKQSIAALKAEIESLEAQVNAKKAALNDINNRMQNYLQADDIASYNALVPAQNAAVASYNSTVRLYNSKIAEHNSKVKEVNQKVLRQNQLVNSIDSKYELEANK